MIHGITDLVTTQERGGFDYMDFAEITARESARHREWRNRTPQTRAHVNEYQAAWMRRYRFLQKIRKAEAAGEIIPGGYRPYNDILTRCKIK